MKVSSEDLCPGLEDTSCIALENEEGDYDIPPERNDHGFQTPPRNDALGNYLSTFQDMRYLVGWIELSYNAAKTRCIVKFNAIVNPDLGTEGTDYEILYTFGNKDEQDYFQITATAADDSYPSGMGVSCRIINKKTGTEAVSLTLQDVYFMWDNQEINTGPEYKDGQRGAIVELFGWGMEDIGEECGFLGIAGYLGVKIFSPYETLLSDTMTEGTNLNPWWYGTQFVSFKYECRSGNPKQFKKIITRCRAANVRVYAEIVINHTTGDGNDMNPIHYNEKDCGTWGPKTGSGGSPFYTKAYQIANNYYTGKPHVNENPSVPYLPSDFHCGKGVDDWDDPTELCYGSLAGLQDLNTEKEYVQRRIATYMVDLMGFGVSGFNIVNGRHIPNFSFAKIFRYTKEYLGNELPKDFFAMIAIENAAMNVVLCSGDEDEKTILDFGSSFTQLLRNEGFTDKEISQIKFWFKGNLAYEDYLLDFDAGCGETEEEKLKISPSRWAVSLEYSDDINMSTDQYNIYIKDKDVKEHKRILMNDLFLHPRFNWDIRYIFTSYSVGTGVSGVPDGKSESSYCSTDSCRANTVDLPFKRAFNPYSTGYDCGDGEENWIFGEYSRIHRDFDVINAMREWLYYTPEMNKTDEQLYTHDKLKAVCDEKCLICDEQSKLEDKCIFCDSNNDYFPVMENGGKEEYYDCHKKDERVAGYYYSNRDKAFLPCYETCRYCNEMGDINDHKCTMCDYNLVKKPGTKATATTFNCVTSCSYSYYYTENGQYKCTNTPVCPSDKNIYIAEKQKCVSSCREEAPFIYLYNGNCIEECPNGYVPDNVNNLCKFQRVDQCTLGSKSESLSTLYSASMLNSYAKSYKDEYSSYTERHITKITNPNYNIFIFRDFDCVKELNLNIPDLRRITNRRLQENKANTNVTNQTIIPQTEVLPLVDTCYSKVQDSLGFDDKLIVVYIEDVSSLIADKGYLLYNPRTGYKTNFEMICGDAIMNEKEDITADEEAEDKMLRFVYLRPASQSMDGSGPTSCEEGLAPLFRNDMIDYSKCLDRNGTYEGLFYDLRSDMFIPCHENCKYCSRAGTATENNCQECAESYIKHPLDGRIQNYNCVAGCTYSYFLSTTNVYTCTPGPTCPRNYRYYIPSRNQCIDACKNDDVFIYTYNGNCVQECPAGYKPDEDKGICAPENVEEARKTCTTSKKETTLRNFEDSGGLDTLVSNYYEEYFYTTKHVSEYNSSEYSIIIYIEKSCLTELNLNFPVVDFGECYKKVQNDTGLLNNSLIVVLLKKQDVKTGRTSSSYSLYSPLDGSKLDAATICKDEEIVVEENVFEILQESGINYESMMFLTDQNIDIFDSSGAFYTDICYEFESPIDRDITLEDRLETFYPNVSLCDPGCESKGVNLTTMKAICSCTFNDISNAGMIADIEYLNEVLEIISSSNIQVLKCMKFMFKKFGSSVGGFLMLFCMIIVIAMGLIFYFKDMDRIKQYIINKTTAFINYLNEMAPEEEEKKTNILINSIDDKIDDNKAKNQNQQNSKIDFKEQKQDSIEQKGDVLLLNKINNSKEVLANNNIENKLNAINKGGKDTNYYDHSEKIDFKDYLARNVDDQEFEDIMLEDKRTFKEFFLEALNDKQLFVKTFNVVDPFCPSSLKLIIFILNLILYMVINGLFYGEDEISKIYHIEGDDPFFGFVTRSITRYIYSAVVGVIINIIIDLFFVQEKKMKGIFNREKKNIVNLKVQITKLSKEIVIRYIAFIIFVLVLFLLLMFYLLCFNYVYPHTQGDWIKSSIFLIIIMQILSLLIALLQTGLRFAGFRFRSEKLFKLSKLLD